MESGLTNAADDAMLAARDPSDGSSVEEETVLQRPTPTGRRLPTVAAALAIAVMLGGPARAAAPEPSPISADDPAVLERSLYKTLVFEGGTNLLDLALFASILGGHIYAGPAFLAVNASAAAAIYYGHEVAWGYLGPPAEDYEIRDNVLKGLTFRLASSTRAFAVGYSFTGDPLAAASFTAASAIGETIMYIANEYGWGLYDRLRVPYAPAAGTPAAVLVPAAWTAGPATR